MNTIDLPIKEDKRLLALEELDMFPITQEDNYDNITKLASFICDTPVSLITIIGKDKQFFKSKVGTEIMEADREISHCTHAIMNPEELMIVSDTREDHRFKNNPYTTTTPPILFYAGMPLKSKNGSALGTLCVLDTKPRELNEVQKDALKALATQVENLFSLRKQNLDLINLKDQLSKRNNQLKDFAGIVAHDMKMPLANIIITTDLLRAMYKDTFDDKGKEYLNYLKKSSFKLSNYIGGILDHYESDTLTDGTLEEFDIHDLLEQIIDLLNISDDCVINLPDDNIIMNCNKIALQQIFINLIGNSLKYNNNEKIEISVNCEDSDEFYNFTVKDNGIGIPKDKQKDIFKLFTVIASKDRTGNKGNGIGLSTVKKLIESLGGEISVESAVNQGATFQFTIKKTKMCTDEE